MRWLAVLWVLLLTESRAFLSRSLHDGMPQLVPVQPSVDTRVEIHEAAADFFLSLSPCSLVHWKLFRVHPGDDSWRGERRRFSGEEEKSKERDKKELLELVAGEEGDKQMLFYSNKLAGEHLLLLISAATPSSVRILQASSQESLDDFLPPLPSDRTLIVGFSNESDETQSALLTWKISSAILDSAEPSRYRFCAVVSGKEPRGWQECEESEEAVESIHCVNHTTNHLHINAIRKSHRLFISLFVRDSKHGLVSVYDSLEVAGEEGDKQEDSLPLLQDESLTERVLKEVSVDGPRGNTVSLSFDAGKTNRRSLLVVHSCDGYVRVSVSRRGRLLKRSDAFTGFRRFLILNSVGKIRVEIINDDQKKNTVRLWIGSRAEESPFPMLPEDTSVKVVRRGCDWATLQWLRASDAHAEYCIYQRRETANFLEQLVSRAANLCATGTLPANSLVGCYSHRGNSSPDVMGVIETTLQQLQPDATFRFDLLATPLNRTQPQSLPYRTVWVRTAASC